MDFFKKMFDFNINDENLTEKEQREIDEIAILQDYIDKYSLNFTIVFICRALIFNGFSAKEAVSTIDENKEYTSEQILTFQQFEKMYSTENGLDYTKYKETVIEYFFYL